VFGNVTGCLRIDAETVPGVGMDARGVERDRRNAADDRAHRGQAAALRMPGDGEVVAAAGIGEMQLELARRARGHAAELVVALLGLESGTLLEIVHPVGAGAVG